MKALFFFLVLWIALPASADTQSDRVDRLFANYVGRVPGASVLIARDGQAVYQQAYGMADLEGEVAATVATNYRLASLTKQFTALAILQLAERGRLQLDATLRSFFPSFPAYGDRITVRHLLHHQSGLTDYEDLIPSGQSEQLSDRDVLELIAKRTSGTDFTPGSRYRYSNSGYVLLGLIVAEASKRSFPEFLRDNIFLPIGMADSLAYVAGGPAIAHRAYGYTRGGGSFRRTDQSVTSATLGDGGVYTSVADLLLWDRALYDEYLVSAATLKQLFTPAKLNDGSTTSYAMGWVIDSYRAHRRASHTGSTIGFRTGIARYLDDRLTVAVLVNRADSAPWTIAERIAEIYLP